MKMIILSPTADKDLQDIWHDIGVENGNPDAADSILNTLKETFILLGRFPKVGPVASEFVQYVPQLRTYSVSGYVVFYRAIEDGIQIGRVVHSRMHRESAFLKWFLIDQP